MSNCKTKTAKFRSQIPLGTTPKAYVVNHRQAKKFDSLELSRMQDIGGLRIVEPTIDDIKKFMTVVSIKEKKINPDDDYYVLELTVKDDGKSNIKIMSFKICTDSLAEDFYRFREQETQNQKNVSVLMIRADKFVNIKSEYPNYFLDTQKFINELSKLSSNSA